VQKTFILVDLNVNCFLETLEDYEKFETGFGVTTIPTCYSSEDCQNLRKAENFVIILYKDLFVNGGSSESYASYRLLANGSIDEIRLEEEMPWRLPIWAPPSGRFWPTNFTLNSDFRPSVFISFSRELLFIINDKREDKSKFVWY
jgi:ABC-type cobalt transport system substrate-binding protein